MADPKRKSTVSQPKQARSYVRLSDAEQARVAAVAEALGATPAPARTKAFQEGLEVLESRVLGARGNGSENAMGNSSEAVLKKPLKRPWMSESERADPEARIDDLEACVSGLSEALSGTLSILSWVVSEQVAAEQDEDDEEAC